MWKAVFTAIALSSVIGASLSSQSQKFTGVWESTTNPAVVWTVEQSPTDVALHLTVRDREVRTTKWTLGGSPVLIPNAVGSAPAQTSASMDGESLVFKGPIELPSGSSSYQQTWRLEEQGERLVVATLVVATAGTNFSREETFKKRR